MQKYLNDIAGADRVWKQCPYEEEIASGRTPSQKDSFEKSALAERQLREERPRNDINEKECVPWEKLLGLTWERPTALSL